MKLEVAKTPVVEDEEPVEVEVEVSSDEVVEVEEDYEDAMGDIEELMADEENFDF